MQVLLAIALLQSAPVSEPLIQAPAVFGIGSKSCREWTLYKTTKDTRTAEEQWLGGFLSGMILVESLDGVSDFVRDSDKFTDLIGVADDFCAAHPLEGVDAASRNLFAQLAKRRNGKTD